MCDPIWHVISRSRVVIATNCYIRFTLLLSNVLNALSAEREMSLESAQCSYWWWPLQIFREWVLDIGTGQRYFYSHLLLFTVLLHYLMAERTISVKFIHWCNLNLNQLIVYSYNEPKYNAVIYMRNLPTGRRRIACNRRKFSADEATIHNKMDGRQTDTWMAFNQPFSSTRQPLSQWVGSRCRSHASLATPQRRPFASVANIGRAANRATGIGSRDRVA